VVDADASAGHDATAPKDAKAPDSASDAGDGGLDADSDAASEGAADSDAPSDGPTGGYVDAIDWDAWAGTPAGSLCSSSCAPGQTVCQNGCSAPDWRLGCGDFCWAPPPSTVHSCQTIRALPTCSATDACTVAQCWSGYGLCNGACVDFETTTNCGACGNACGPGELCSAAGCVSSCAAPLTACGSRCADLSTDPEACGACGKACNQFIGPIGDPSATEVCVASKCQPACRAGFSPCQNTLGACADFQNDPANCGACGNVCPVPLNGRAICVAGKCQGSCQPGWRVVGNVCESPPAHVEWLATGVGPDGLAVDGTAVYWTDSSGSVLSVPVGGGPVTTRSPPGGGPHRVAVDATNVYWTDWKQNALMKAPKDGSGAPQSLAAITTVGDVAVLGGSVYWTDVISPSTAPTRYELLRVLPAGGAPTVVQSADVAWSVGGPCWGVPTDFAHDSTHLVLSLFCDLPQSVDDMYTAVDQSGTASGLGGMTLPPAVWVGVDDASFYVEQSGTPGPGIDVRDAVTHSVSETIPLPPTSDVPPPVEGIPGVGDGCALYYVSKAGIEMLVHGTTFPALIVPSTTVNRIAVYGGYVYWTDSTGAIGRAAVP
jgi:hypothetical protein